MAGFSMLLVIFWLGFILLSTMGALSLLAISLVLFLVKGKTQNGRKFPARKGIAIALLVLGCLLLLPLGITAYGIAVGTGWENMRKIQAVEAIGNETYVPDDEWKNGVD